LDFPFQEFFEFIKTKQKFLVSCHIHPDGDAIGSTLAMGNALSQMGKQVTMVCREGVPNVYHFLEGSSLIQTDVDPGYAPEVLICVDCAEKERVALPATVWKNPKLQIVNIDHHITNTGFGLLNIIQPNAAATGEVIFRLLTAGSITLNRNIAIALYTAIATDTGFFRYTNTSWYTMEVAAQLVKDYQVDLSKVAEQVHEQKSYNSIRLLGEVLNTIQVGIGGKVAWAILNQPMLDKYPVENEETESYVNYARSIEGVEVGILFKELHPGEIKLSWRSTTAVDVSKLAANFGGGGHARAAGCNIDGPLDKVVSEVLKYVSDFYNGYVARNTSY
jgi:bifunctional oligoribonuclease and PAP phosphatase NrnA